MSSARPPYTTIFVLPSADSPAVSANGTVNPSDKPIVASLIICFLSNLNFGPTRSFSSLKSVTVVCDSKSEVESEYGDSLDDRERGKSVASSRGLRDATLSAFEHWDWPRALFFRPRKDVKVWKKVMKIDFVLSETGTVEIEVFCFDMAAVRSRWRDLQLNN